MATLAELLRDNNPNAVVQDIYRNVLGREADPSAYSWANQINSDEPTSIAELARRISASEEGKAYSSANPDSQWNYLSNISRENAPTTTFDASGMQYLGGNSYIDRAGNKVQIDENGEAISYKPSESWYDQQLAQNPDALRGMNYRNQTYLASGPLQQTMNFQGKEIPMELAEYQVDPETGKFVKGATGENVPLQWKDPEYDMWADWAGPAAVVAIPALAAGAVYAAPYLAAEGAAGAGALGAGEGAGAVGAGDVFAGYSATGSAAGTAGTTVPAGYGAAATGATAAGEAASQGLTLKDAYNAYKYGKTGIGALNALSGAGGQTGTYGNQGINSPYAMSTGFNPGPPRSGLGIDSAQTGAQSTSPWANLAPNITLSKLSEFAPDYMASGGIAQGMAQGGMGHLGSYSDGGRLLKGPGDGMSDHIPATIGAKQPARLAEGEFVVPADVVSHLGNGSTDAGAKQLYKMMDNIRKARTGNPKQGKQINPDKFTPKG